MNILRKVTWKAMWENKTRTIVTIIGIILSAAMFMAVTTLAFSLWSFLVRGEIYDRGDWFVRYDYATDGELEAIQERPVTNLADYQLLGICNPQPDSIGPMNNFLLAAGSQTLFDAMPIHLTQGRLPENSREIVLPELLLDSLEYYGMSTAIGSTIDLSLVTDFAGYPDGIAPGVSKEPFRASYTVTGYIDEAVYALSDMGYLSMLTLADGNQGEAIWHSIFVKCMPNKAQSLYKLDYGLSRRLNTSLLNLYGTTLASNINLVILGLVAIFCLIILVGSVSLIHNAFSISVAERTKQFGLLCGIGATKKQLRFCVFWEALTLSGIGIPLGLLSGWVGISITLNLLSSRIDTVISLGNGTVTLRPELSVAAVVAAAVVALLTVLISAVIPARRATRITPMEAIRQSQDYAMPKTGIRVSRLSRMLFGLPGILAKKYYKVSRKKYRATVISLAISVVLFITASCFSNSLRNHINNFVTREAYDKTCYNAEPEDQLILREQPFVSQSARLASDHFMVYATDEQLSEEFLSLWEELQSFYEGSRNFEDLTIFYLEDEVLRDYLLEKNIDPAPYFDKEDPMALVCSRKYKSYFVQNEKGEWVTHFFQYAPFAESTQRLPLFASQPPKELMPPSAGEGPNFGSYEYHVEEDGSVYLEYHRLVDNGNDLLVKDQNSIRSYLLRFTEDADGRGQIHYHPHDPATGKTAAESAAVQQAIGASIRLGATIDALPYGVPTSAMGSITYQALILPFSLAPENVQAGSSLNFSVSDYAAAINYLRNHESKLRYSDFRSDQELNRALLLMIDVFSAGFVILVSLICIANVFNTISTNIGLRRRDFGMLRSVGMREKDILKMMSYECLRYGCTALVWGLPIALGMSLVIHEIDNGVSFADYAPPWAAMAIAVASVFCVVFITMLYAVSKLRKDNPIDAIRMENI